MYRVIFALVLLLTATTAPVTGQPPNQLSPEAQDAIARGIASDWREKPKEREGFPLSWIPYVTSLIVLIIIARAIDQWQKSKKKDSVATTATQHANNCDPFHWWPRDT